MDRMSSRDWFRRTSWSDRDREEFDKRLARARPHSRAQYLRIQAGHLAATGDAYLTRVALDLLSRMLTDYPEPFQLAMAHAQRAECLLRLVDWSGAVEAFREALGAERANPTVRTDAYLRFCYLVVTRDARDLLDEAARVAKEHEQESRPFPAEQFQWHVIQALLSAANHADGDASEHARAALVAADARQSGFRYHASLGLVHEIEPALEARLRTLAGVDAQ
jgi:hypothetical protein